MGPEFRIVSARIGAETYLVSVVGDLEEYPERSEARVALAAALESGRPRIVIDLRGVVSLGAAALELLGDAAESCAELGVELLLVAEHPRALARLELIPQGSRRTRRTLADAVGGQAGG